MWKVKRMNTARIVVLTIAVTGGIAAYLANGSDNTSLLAEPVLPAEIRAPSLTKTLK